MSSPVKTPIILPPHKPTRNPSRPQLRSASVSSSNLSSPKKIIPDSPSISESSSLGEPADRPLRPGLNRVSRPPSAIYIGSDVPPPSQAVDPKFPVPLSPNLGRINGSSTSAAGFTTVKVGLGSPRLDFRSDWSSTKGRRDESNSRVRDSESEPVENGFEPSLDISMDDIPRSEAQENVAPRPPPRSPSRNLSGGEFSMSKRTGGNTLVDRVSGLPSPPSTESDIGSKGRDQVEVKGSPSRSQDQNLVPPLTSKRTSSLSPNSPKRISSLSPSESPRSTPFRNPSVRPRISPSLSQSSSSSSSLGHIARTRSMEREGTTFVGSPLKDGEGFRELDTSSKRRSGDFSQYDSPPWRTVENGEESRQWSPRKRSILLDKSSTSTPSGSRGSITPERLTGHHHSPSMPSSLSSSSERIRPRRSGSGNWENGLIKEEADQDLADGEILDRRIREAEERIRRSGSVRRNPPVSNHGKVPSPIKTRPQELSLSRSNSISSSPASATIRRSATMSGSRTRISSQEQQTPERQGSGVAVGYSENVNGDLLDERDRSGGSSGSGKRKPLPMEFRQSSPFTPSPRPSTISTSRGYHGPSSGRYTRSDQYDSPIDSAGGPSPLPQRYGAASRLSRDSTQDRMVTSPSMSGLGPRSRLSFTQGMDRPASILGSRSGDGGYIRRQWTESMSGLPRTRNGDDLDDRGLPVPRTAYPRDRQRAESVMETAVSRYRYTDRGGSAESGLTEKGRPLRPSIPNIQDHDLDRGLSISSRFGLAPSDSISAVGMSAGRSERGTPGAGDKKDPLDVLRRIEQSRAQHNRRWEEDRSGSVLGDIRPGSTGSGGRERLEKSDLSRPSSRFDHQGLQHPRSATSMSSVREVYNDHNKSYAPRTAPGEYRYRRGIEDGATGPESPLNGRGSRMSQFGLERGARTEPRHVRSITSLGGRSGGFVDLGTAGTDHGRLLFEAFRSLEAKLSLVPELSVPDFTRTLQGHTKSSETVNTILRSAIQLASQITLAVDMEDSTSVSQDLGQLNTILREASRSSDQSVRDLTRIMLDLPKIVMHSSRMSPSFSTGQTGSVRGGRNGNELSDPRRWAPSIPDAKHSASTVTNTINDQAGSTRARWSVDSPLRSGGGQVRPVTSMGEFSSPQRYSRDSSYQFRERGDSLRSITGSHFSRNRVPPRSALPTLQSLNDLSSIEQSPPTANQEQLDSTAGDASTGSPGEGENGQVGELAERMPRSIGLRHKASTISTHTVRASNGFNAGHTPTNAFFPTSSRAGTTTAVSTITAGQDDEDASPARSLRSRRLTDREGEGEASSPSRSKWFGGNGSERPVSFHSASGSEGDSIAALERSLALAAKAREEGKDARDKKLGLGRVGEDQSTNGIERRPSISERFKSHLRRGSGTV